jgi:hypothetical protein
VSIWKAGKSARLQLTEYILGNDLRRSHFPIANFS